MDREITLIDVSNETLILVQLYSLVGKLPCESAKSARGSAY